MAQMSATPGDSQLPAVLRQLLGSNWASLEEDTIQLLQKLIQIDTQNRQDEGSEIEAVRLLETFFKEAGIDYEVVEPRPGRGNIIARIPGDGSLGKGALLLSAHLDTVKAPRENWEAEGWKHNPYGGEIDEEDGCLYGRGAIDMKQMAAMSVTLLCFIKKKGISLGRDLIFAGIADEERTTSTWGAKYLVENRPELVEADIVFNEVGGFTINIQGLESVFIQIAEKGSAQIKISAHGPGGHGSVYHATNPLATIGDVAHTLHATSLPLRVNTANASTIESMAACLPFPKSVVFRRILNPFFSDIIMNRLVPPQLQGSLAPILRNTANPTSMGGGGDQFNQIPTSAWVKVDGRILPECDEKDLLDDIKSVLGPSRFIPPPPGPDGEEKPAELEIEILASRGPCWQDPEEVVCSEVLEIIRKVVYNRTNGSPIAPSLIPGATDSYWYSRHPNHTPVCIGFTPIRFEPDLKFSDLFHGVNERIPVAGLKWGVKVFADVVCMVCGAKVYV
jgi:acetylornithine deacetylase/succinyl-diaminopimelate desuccinylase-like protein